jgi:Domain of unknown function DUF29
MSKTANKRPPNNLYETDFHAWTQNQARAIAEHRWSDVDAVNVADEIGSLGLQLEREIGDRLEILLSYLLKWQRLAEYRGLAWKENIDRQRQELADLFAENPSLSGRKDRGVAHAYGHARRRLKYETYFFTTDFPASCPFTVKQVFDPEYFPEELDAPATGAFPTARSIGR